MKTKQSVAVVAMFVGVGVARGQEGAGQATLDELLDLPTPSRSQPEVVKPGASSGADAALDDAVRRRLSERDAGGEVLSEAAGDMRTAAARLGRDLDTGLDTQRLQQEVIDKLDRVIASAKKQQGGGGSSSSGSSSGSSPNAPRGADAGSGQNAGQTPRGGAGQPAGATAGRTPGGEPGTQPGEGLADPAARSGEQNDPLSETRSEWGNLPPRLRSELLEGTREKFSPLYQELTQRYYQRLAEEGR